MGAGAGPVVVKLHGTPPRASRSGGLGIRHSVLVLQLQRRQRPPGMPRECVNESLTSSWQSGPDLNHAIVSQTPPEPCAYLKAGRRFKGWQQVRHGPKGEHWIVEVEITVRDRAGRASGSVVAGVRAWALVLAGGARQPTRLRAVLQSVHRPFFDPERLQDYEPASGRLSGLLEAYSVPESDKPVTTFLEGEVVDNRNHSFLTSDWGAGAETDIRHWSRFKAFQPLRRVRGRAGGGVGAQSLGAARGAPSAACSLSEASAPGRRPVELVHIGTDRHDGPLPRVGRRSWPAEGGTEAWRGIGTCTCAGRSCSSSRAARAG